MVARCEQLFARGLSPAAVAKQTSIDDSTLRAKTTLMAQTDDPEAWMKDELEIKNGYAQRSFAASHS